MENGPLETKMNERQQRALLANVGELIRQSSTATRIFHDSFLTNDNKFQL